ncbi:MAG: ACT domain-containing protein, partial [Planctomycetaceae bacterium]
VVGSGMATQTNVASRMFRALADAGVNIQMITTGEIKISALVSRDQAELALRAVHQAFTLDKAPADAKTWTQIRAERAQAADVQSVVARLRADALEGLTLTGISVSGTQARVTLHGVPDHPGIAADVFEEIGRAGILVDMIVQGFDGLEGSTSISFTTDEANLARGLRVAQDICTKFHMRSAHAAGGIVKVTVSGIGLRSHTQVAEILFKTLADAKINIQMINTSELQVNTVIDAAHAETAHQWIVSAFTQSLDSGH